MRNTIKSAIVAATITGAALAGAGTAAADSTAVEVGYLEYLTDHGLYMEGVNAAGRMVASGYRVCQDLSTNSALDIAHDIYRVTDQSVTREDAIAIVAASEAFLCPVYLSTPADQPGFAPAPPPPAAPSPLV